MSKLSRRPIIVPAGVSVALTQSHAVVRGQYGELQVKIPAGIKITQKDNSLSVARDNDLPLGRALHGLVWRLLENAVHGVGMKFQKVLELKGIGFRAAVENNAITLNLGFSHPNEIAIPTELQVQVEKNIVVTISGVNKQLVGEFAARIRRLRPPEPYKGKGIHYRGEIIRRKAGKAAKGAVAVK